MKQKIKHNEANCVFIQRITSSIRCFTKYLGLFLKDLINGDEFTIYKLK